tara:strand:+ start:283 stop:897 length:615 start_codon:yes stop_codon:yes gene_type:complete
MNNFDEYFKKITGHLQIAKRFSSGEEEIVFDDHNVIVSGMSVGLSYLFTASGSDSILDYQLDRFQLGLSGEDSGGSSIYQLSANLSSFNEYGGTTGAVRLVSGLQIKNGIANTKEPYGLIPFSQITRISDTSIRYTIIIDRDAVNNVRNNGVTTATLPINEIGLFMRNPRGVSPIQSILVAYRKFSNLIKTSDFALVFRWTINW